MEHEPNPTEPETATFDQNPPPPPPPPAPGSQVRQPSGRFGPLQRTDGPISGVSGGLADYFGVDPTIVRLAMVAGTLLGGPTVPIAYIAAWIIIPEADPSPTAPIVDSWPSPGSAANTPVPPHPDAPAPATPPAPHAPTAVG